MTKEQLLEVAKPILFNTDMVKAILDGRKTVTRRGIKFPEGQTGHLPESGRRGYIYYPGGIKYPPYQPGDTLYVRETWSELKNINGSHRRYVYRASDTYPFGETSYIVKFRWHPSIHMPKAAARIFLRVKDVRVERLMDITEEQALKEGCTGIFGGTGETVGSGWSITPIDEFSKLWNSTLKNSDLDRYGWEANLYVWVIEFERVYPESEG